LEASGALTPAAIAVILGLCAIWGANMAIIKLSNAGIPPLIAVTLRNAGAAIPVAAYLLWRRIPLVHRDRRALFGLVIGVLFGLDFLFFYWGASLTNASRGVIFLYTQPFWVALGANALFPDDRLTGRRVAGLLLALAGLAAVFLTHSGAGSHHTAGDLMMLTAAGFWAATTLFIKATTRSVDVPPSSTLFYQLVFSLPLLGVAAFLLERHDPIDPTPVAVASLLFQTFIVAAASYAVWYWMVQRYQVTALSSFTMVTPMFGVLAGWLILGEALPPLLLVGLVLVSVGIYLVQAVPARAVSRRETGGASGA
jgi:drug/metabolite transporter (DMT)-like permease